MLGFDKENQAMLVHKILTADITHELIDAIVFKDNKRPITVSLLNRINIETISKKVGLHDEYKKIFTAYSPPKQLSLFNKNI